MGSCIVDLACSYPKLPSRLRDAVSITRGGDLLDLGGEARRKMREGRKKEEEKTFAAWVTQGKGGESLTESIVRSRGAVVDTECRSGRFHSNDDRSSCQEHTAAGVPVARPQDHHTGTLIRSLPLRSGLSRVQRGTRSLLLSHTQHFSPLHCLSLESRVVESSPSTRAAKFGPTRLP